MRGIKQGIRLDSGNASRKLDSIVVCGAERICSILFASSVLGKLDLKVVVCSAPSINFIITLVSSDTLVVKMEDITCLTTVPIEENTLAIVEGSSNASLMRLFSAVGVQKRISSGHPRRLRSAWRKVGYQVEHRLFGGVTDHHNKFWISSHTTVSPKLVNMYLHERDAYTVIDDRNWSR